MSQCDTNMDHVFRSFPTLETDNLYLRAIVPDDAADLLRVFGDEEVTRYYDLYTMTEMAEAEDMVEFFAESFELERGIRWGIARKTDNILIGTCGYVWLRPHRGEIGYELRRDSWGQGIMAEAVHAIVEFGFAELGLNRIEALVMVENAASTRLLNKLGFTQEGILREHDFFKDQFHDMRCFAILKREFINV